jgi:hypothetical protein
MGAKGTSRPQELHYALTFHFVTAKRKSKMGAWGVGNFENDDALDWITELSDAEDSVLIEETLKAVTERGEEYLESPEACKALAAAEVIAALKNAGSGNLPDEVKEWVGSHRQTTGNNLVSMARNAIEHIKTNSELQELWGETEQAKEWQGVLDDLMARLQR